MRIEMTKPLFAWDCLEDNPTLKTIKQLLEIIPDAALISSMEDARGKGRNDYSLRTLWGVLILSVALRHPTIESFLGELRRNESLRKILGIESEDAIPKKWNLSRFLENLGKEPHLSLLHKVFDSMIQELGDVVPDLGRDTAGDATGLNARRTRKKTQQDADSPLPQATGGTQRNTPTTMETLRRSWSGLVSNCTCSWM